MVSAVNSSGIQDVNLRKLALAPIAAAVMAMEAVAFASPGYADTVSIFNFGTQITGSIQPSTSFATLAVSSTGDDHTHYRFDLKLLGNFGTVFGNPDAFVGKVLFNTDNVDPIASSVALLSGSWGVSSIKYSSSGQSTGGYSWDFSETLGQGSANRLTTGEEVKWKTDFSAPTTFVAPQFALHVQSIGTSGTSGWYIPTVAAIPEPETYAMLLAGLGLMGFVMRRRKENRAMA